MSKTSSVVAGVTQQSGQREFHSVGPTYRERPKATCLESISKPSMDKIQLGVLEISCIWKTQQTA